MSEVFTLQSSEIEENWPWIAGFLGRVKDAPWTLDDVKAELVERRAQLWGLQDTEPSGIWITKIEGTGRLRWGLLWIAAGQPMDEGLRLFREYTEPWLRAQGCAFVQVIGRKGWERALPDYQNRGIVLVKELT